MASSQFSEEEDASLASVDNSSSRVPWYVSWLSSSVSGREDTLLTSLHAFCFDSLKELATPSAPSDSWGDSWLHHHDGDTTLKEQSSLILNSKGNSGSSLSPSALLLLRTALTRALEAEQQTSSRLKQQVDDLAAHIAKSDPSPLRRRQPYTAPQLKQLHADAKRHADFALRLERVLAMHSAYVDDASVRERVDGESLRRLEHEKFCEEQMSVLSVSAHAMRDVKEPDDALKNALDCMNAGVSYYEAAGRLIDKAEELVRSQPTVPVAAVRQMRAGLLLLWNRCVQCEAECTEALEMLHESARMLVAPDESGAGDDEHSPWEGALLQLRAASRDKESSRDLMMLDLHAAMRRCKSGSSGSSWYATHATPSEISPVRHKYEQDILDSFRRDSASRRSVEDGALGKLSEATNSKCLRMRTLWRLRTSYEVQGPLAPMPLDLVELTTEVEAARIVT